MLLPSCKSAGSLVKLTELLHSQAGTRFTRTYSSNIPSSLHIYPGRTCACGYRLRIYVRYDKYRRDFAHEHVTVRRYEYCLPSTSRDRGTQHQQTSRGVYAVTASRKRSLKASQAAPFLLSHFHASARARRVSLDRSKSGFLKMRVYSPART